MIHIIEVSYSAELAATAHITKSDTTPIPSREFNSGEKLLNHLLRAWVEDL